MKKIKRNAAKCLNCQQILDVTDYPVDKELVCNCHGTRLSGGKEYVQIAGLLAYGFPLTEWEDASNE